MTETEKLHLLDAAINDLLVDLGPSLGEANLQRLVGLRNLSARLLRPELPKILQEEKLLSGE